MDDTVAEGEEVQQVPMNSRSQEGDTDNSSPANFVDHHDDDPRRRDLFLLPNFVAPGPPRISCSRMVHQRIQRADLWTTAANDGIDALNDMYAPQVPCSFTFTKVQNHSQTLALAHIKDVYIRDCEESRADTATPQEALGALLAKTSLHNNETSTVCPYVKSAVALPPAGSVPTDL